MMSYRSYYPRAGRYTTTTWDIDLRSSTPHHSTPLHFRRLNMTALLWAHCVSPSLLYIRRTTSRGERAGLTAQPTEEIREAIPASFDKITKLPERQSGSIKSHTVLILVVGIFYKSRRSQRSDWEQELPACWSERRSGVTTDQTDYQRRTELCSK